MEMEKTEAAASEHKQDKKNHKEKKKLSETEKLQHEIEQLNVEKAELQDMLLRKAAEFDNYRKRMLKEKDEYRVTANKDLVAAILPILDNFDRGIKTSEESKNFDALLEGIKMVHSQIHDLFEGYHVRPIECIGKEFDPNLHEAMLIEDRADIEFEKTVIEEFEKGYMMGDAVLRHSKVKVAKKIEKEIQSEE